jgi:hypothetical protein
VEIRRVVDLKARFHDKGLVECQWSPVLIIDIARQQEIRPAIEDHAQLAARRRDVMAAEAMIRMVQVADVAIADTSRDRDRSHHPVAHERAAGPRTAAKLLEIPGCEIGGHLQSFAGGLEIRLIAPATAFRPYSVPCGPRSTSTRSISRNCPNAIAGRAR